MIVRIVRTVNEKRIEKTIECEGYDITRSERGGEKYLTIEFSPRKQLFAVDEIPGNEIYIMNNRGQNIEVWKYNNAEGCFTRMLWRS